MKIYFYGFKVLYVEIEFNGYIIFFLLQCFVISLVVDLGCNICSVVVYVLLYVIKEVSICSIFLYGFFLIDVYRF